MYLAITKVMGLANPVHLEQVYVLVVQYPGSWGHSINVGHSEYKSPVPCTCIEKNCIFTEVDPCSQLFIECTV